MPDDRPSLLSPREARFRDRRHAGRRLADLFAGYRDRHSLVVVGIPRGGVPVAAEVARALEAPLDVTVVRKVGAPANPEYAIGALAEGGVCVFSEPAVRAAGLSDSQLDELTMCAGEELRRRLAHYRGKRAPVPLSARTAILVDDGLATGRSALAAVRSLRERGAAHVVLAVPVGASEAMRRLRGYTDEAVCLHEPDDLGAVGCWYEDFRPVTDAEVVSALAAPAAASRLL